MSFSREETQRYLEKWQQILRLRDWDIRLQMVNKPWRKSGDIKMDRENRNAVLLVNGCNPRQTNLEGLVIHELLHLKLWDMDQLLEGLLDCVYGEDEADPRRELAHTQFMVTLESTVNDLAKSFLEQGGEDKTLSLGRLAREVEEEIGG